MSGEAGLPVFGQFREGCWSDCEVSCYGERGEMWVGLLGFGL